MSKIIKEKINKIQKEITSNGIVNINNGGCIHFANYLSTTLKKHKVDHKVVIFDYTIGDIREGLKNHDSFPHVAIYIPRVGIIDGINIYKRNCRLSSTIKKMISPKEFSFKSHILKGTWNPSYNVQNNKKLRKIIKTTFYGN